MDGHRKIADNRKIILAEISKIVLPVISYPLPAFFTVLYAQCLRSLSAETVKVLLIYLFYLSVVAYLS